MFILLSHQTYIQKTLETRDKQYICRIFRQIIGKILFNLFVLRKICTFILVLKYYCKTTEVVSYIF